MWLPWRTGERLEKSNLQHRTRLFSRDKYTYFGGEVIARQHGPRTGSLPDGFMELMQQLCVLKVWPSLSASDFAKNPAVPTQKYSVETSEDLSNSPRGHHTPAVWQQFNFQTVISDHGSYLGGCILQAEIPQSPARRDFSVSSTFAAPCSTGDSIRRWIDTV